MRAISELGGTTYVVVAALAVTAIELLRDRRWTIPAFVAMTIGGQFLLSNGIKWIVDRARPSISPLTGFAGTSFPSGHAVAAAATWACVAFLLGRRRHRHAVRCCWAARSRSPSPSPPLASLSGFIGRRTWSPGCSSAGRGSRCARSRSVAGCCTSANRLRSSRPRRTNRSPFAPRKPVAEATITPARVSPPRAAGRPPPSRSWRCGSICAFTPQLCRRRGRPITGATAKRDAARHCPIRPAVGDVDERDFAVVEFRRGGGIHTSDTAADSSLLRLGAVSGRGRRLAGRRRCRSRCDHILLGRWCRARRWSPLRGETPDVPTRVRQLAG